MANFKRFQSFIYQELFQKSLQLALDVVFPNKFFVDRHPKEFSNIYSDYPLPQHVLNEIYNIDVSKKSWEISMDFAIRNLQNGKILFGEIKRQDGWIENTNMNCLLVSRIHQKLLYVA